MTQQMWTVLENALLALVPLVAAGAVGLYQQWMQRLPDRQRATLNEFAQMAARRTEQLYSAAGGPEKKQIATQTVADLFKSFGLPAPSDKAIDAALEQSVFEINQIQQKEVHPLDPKPTI